MKPGRRWVKWSSNETAWLLTQRVKKLRKAKTQTAPRALKRGAEATLLYFCADAFLRICSTK